MNLEFHKICRLCLRQCKDYVDLRQNNGDRSLSPELKKTINFCYDLQIDLADNLPTKVCLQCVQVLTLFYTTKNNVMVSEQLLKNILYIRKNYESNKPQSFFKSKSDKSSDLIAVEDEEVKNSPCDIETTKIFNKVFKHPINLKHSNCVKRFNNNSQLGHDLLCCHEAESEASSEDLAPETKTNINSVEGKEIKKLHLSGVDEMQITGTMNRQRNFDFLLNHGGIKKLRHTSEKEMRLPTSDQEDKRKKKSKQKRKTRIVKVIGTVIDESNILSPDVKRSRREICPRLGPT